MAGPLSGTEIGQLEVHAVRVPESIRVGHRIATSETIQDMTQIDYIGVSRWGEAAVNVELHGKDDLLIAPRRIPTPLGSPFSERSNFKPPLPQVTVGLRPSGKLFP